MTKKQLTLYLVLGMIAGLFITACAGVAAGKIDLPGAGDVFTLGPSIDAVPAPSLEFARPSNAAQFTFEKAGPAQMRSTAEIESRIEGVIPAQTVREALEQTQMQMHDHALCNRGSP